MCFYAGTPYLIMYVSIVLALCMATAHIACLNGNIEVGSDSRQVLQVIYYICILLLDFSIATICFRLDILEGVHAY